MFQFVTVVQDALEKMVITPNDMFALLKTQRYYTDPKTHQKATSTDFSNVYYHLHQACFSRHNALFKPLLLILLPDVLQTICSSLTCNVFAIMWHKHIRYIANNRKTDMKYSYHQLNI